MSDERTAIIACLRSAIEQLWSGRVIVVSGEDPIGQVVFSVGRIAFATASGQSETLGTFLWRLGKLTRDQLLEVQRRYKEGKGQKQLGTLLEEAGFTKRPLLRRALLLHTRAALARLLRDPDAEGIVREGDYAADESILFGPEEVLPQDWQKKLGSGLFPSTEMGKGTWHRRTEDNAVLEPFSSLAGYIAAAVVAAEGDVVVAHCEDRAVDLQMLAVSVASTIESATRAMRLALPERVEILNLGSPSGGLTARWVCDKERFFLLILTKDGSNPSLTSYTIKTSLPELRRWLPRFLANAKIRGIPAIDCDDVASLKSETAEVAAIDFTREPSIFDRHISGEFSAVTEAKKQAKEPARTSQTLALSDDEDQPSIFDRHVSGELDRVDDKKLEQKKKDPPPKKKANPFMPAGPRTDDGVFLRPRKRPKRD